MITAVFAMGPNGEFGSTTSTSGLPWVFPDELDNFYATLRKINPTKLLIGASSYAKLPESVKGKIISTISRQVGAFTKHTPPFIIFDPKETCRDVRFDPRVDVVLTEISDSIAKLADNERVVCLGGAYLLKELVGWGVLETAHVTEVSINPVYFSNHIKPTLDLEIPNSMRMIYDTDDLAMYLHTTETKYNKQLIDADVFLDELVLEESATKILRNVYKEVNSPLHYVTKTWIF